MTTTRTLLTAALTLGLLAPASAQTLILNGKVSTDKTVVVGRQNLRSTERPAKPGDSGQHWQRRHQSDGWQGGGCRARHDHGSVHSQQRRGRCQPESQRHRLRERMAVQRRLANAGDQGRAGDRPARELQLRRRLGRDGGKSETARPRPSRSMMSASSTTARSTWLSPMVTAGARACATAGRTRPTPNCRRERGFSTPLKLYPDTKLDRAAVLARPPQKLLIENLKKITDRYKGVAFSVPDPSFRVDLTCKK